MILEIGPLQSVCRLGGAVLFNATLGRGDQLSLQELTQIESVSRL
jgi:hypothetical protein